MHIFANLSKRPIIRKGITLFQQNIRKEENETDVYDSD